MTVWILLLFKELFWCETGNSYSGVAEDTNLTGREAMSLGEQFYLTLKKKAKDPSKRLQLTKDTASHSTTGALEVYSVGVIPWLRKNPSCCSGYYMYHQFNVHRFYVLPTRCIYVFCVDLRTNSNYFPLLHQLTGFYN